VIRKQCIPKSRENLIGIRRSGKLAHWVVVKKTRFQILIVDDHRLVFDGLRLIIEKQPDLEVVGEAVDAQSALEHAATCTPDLVLLDVQLPGEHGLEVARKILASLPHVKIMILSACPDPKLTEEALQIGVAGYILKESDSEELVRGIRLVLQGMIYLCPGIMTLLIRLCWPIPASRAGSQLLLSECEQQWLKLLAEGRQNQETARLLGLSPRTVEIYRSRLMGKLGCSSTAELVRYAIRQGIVAPEPPGYTLAKKMPGSESDL
jgi:DNA-binding NarL/FixJ family response regulator